METKPCPICGNEFTKPKVYSRKRWEKRTYCSQACFGKACSVARKPADRECPTCYRYFTPPETAAKYCSIECAKARLKGRRGVHHPSWKGGRHIDRLGYAHILVPDDHPYASMRRNTRYALEHRIVMAEHLGRPLTRSETVHHINGDRQDNRTENLQLHSGRHGKGQHMRCRTCGSTDIEHTEI
jgi:hypothetical protein